MIVLNISVVAISLLYILIGRFTNEKNAKHLFAGYRGMSKAEQEKYDIKGIVKFFKHFISYLGICSMLLYFIISYLFDYNIAILVWITSQTIFLLYLVIKLNSSNYKKN